MTDTFFAEYLERLENLHGEFRAAVQDLPAEAVDWAPGPEMNSVAVLLAHTAGSLRYWIGDVALGDPSGRDRESEFRTRGLSGAELVRRLDAVVEYARGTLPSLRLEDLAKEHAAADRNVTCAWALLHALEYGSIHLGHIQITTQMWRQKNE